MRKIVATSIKDLQIIFNDRSALIMILLAPLLLTLGLGFVTGAFGTDDGPSGISDIAVIIVNADAGVLGENLVALFKSDDLAPLFVVTEGADVTAARQQVDEDSAAAVVFVPSGFTAGMIPDAQSGETAAADPIQLYTNPNTPISASIVEAIVNQFVGIVETGVTKTTVTIRQLVTAGVLTGQDVGTVVPEIGMRLNSADAAPLITLANSRSEAQADSFDPLAFLAPGMALFFLMYTATVGGRSVRQERENGTLNRMLTTPTSETQILAGKMVGTFLTGVLQVGVLIIGTSLLFGVRWGSWAGVILLICAAAIAATGWGLIFAAFFKSSAQINAVGNAVMLLFGIVSGTFVQFGDGVVDQIGKVTPNKWALDGFIVLGEGGGLADIGGNIAALLLMAVVLFGVAVVAIGRSRA
jgi:ABC-2 type transport system permease protein